MRVVLIIVSIVLGLGVLQDAFEAIVLPRRITRRFRFTRFFYRTTWMPWAIVAKRISSRKRRESLLGFYGPLSLILLLVVWAGLLILSFSTLLWAVRAPLHAPGQRSFGYGTYVYMSGTTFFTLGLGDVTPMSTLGRALAVIEAGIGFGFLAMIIGYLPVIYQAFSRREVNISMLDARAGSPPTAAELLRRHKDSMDELDQLMRDWERWAADFLESHISYPLLCYYRSQHNNQSWLSALTAILDVSALISIGVDGASQRQAKLTFAMARHAVVDLAQIFNTPPRPPSPDRLPPAKLAKIQKVLAANGVLIADGQDIDEKLAEIRRLYEPYVNGLSNYLFVTLPAWYPSSETFDNWQTSAWERISSGVTAPVGTGADAAEHF